MRTKLFGAILIFAAVICVMFFGVRFFLPQQSYDETPLSHKSYTSDSLDRAEVKNEKTKYFLTLEGERLCAYEEEGGTKSLIHSKALEPMLMSDEEKDKLKEGIYAENYEDLCLYFESYLS